MDHEETDDATRAILDAGRDPNEFEFIPEDPSLNDAPDFPAVRRITVRNRKTARCGSITKAADPTGRSCSEPIWLPAPSTDPEDRHASADREHLMDSALHPAAYYGSETWTFEAR
jgi:hypothetical protein